MSIAQEKYVALTTYRKNGESSSTPVWIADVGDGTLGFTTDPASLKARRINNDSRVVLEASDAKGKVSQGAISHAGTAKIVTGDEVAAIREAIKAKYGWQVTAIGIFGKLRSLIGKGDPATGAVVITLDA